MTNKQKALLAILIGAIIGLVCGCNPTDYERANIAYASIGVAIKISEGIVPQLVKNGNITAQHGDVYLAQLGLLDAINEGAHKCINDTLKNTGPNSVKYLSCVQDEVQAFANDSQAAEALRYTNQDTILEYNKVVTAVNDILTIALKALGGSAGQAPIIQSTADGTAVRALQKSEIAQFRGQVKAAIGKRP